MTITIKTAEGTVEAVLGRFPAGEPLVRVAFDELAGRRVSVDVRGHSALEFLQLCGLLDAAEAAGAQVDLHLPYFPGARQDRRQATPLTARVFADAINRYACRRVTIVDPHSDVTPALIDHVHVVSAADVLSSDAGRRALAAAPTPIVGVLAPDAGACKRASEVAAALGVDFAQAHKHRDPESGRLSRFVAPRVAPGRWLVVDDICDGGGTFIGLAEAFAPLNPDAVLELYVSHGVFSRGVDDLAAHFDRVLCTDSFAVEDPRLTLIPLVGVAL